MKSQPIGNGEAALASQLDSLRDDAAIAGNLLPHQQLGAIALGTNATAGQTLTVTVNGSAVVITIVSSIGTTPNNVLRGSTAPLTMANIINFLRRPDVTNANQVAASSANQALLQYVGWALPSGSTTITPFSLNNAQNAPLSTFTVSTTITSGTYTANTMRLYVEPGIYYINGTQVKFTGGSTPTVTAPVSNPRIDILTIDNTGTLAWTTGTENASPVAPAYPTYTTVVICELYNVVGETALYDNMNQQAGQGYVLNDVRAFPSPITDFTNISQDFIPDTDNTRNLGSNAKEFNTIYSHNIFSGGQAVAFRFFGGTGADGALSISSGTTTINLGNAAVVVKNYTSISITGTGQLAFSNPAPGGTIVILKSQGNVTITSSTVPAIDLRSVGGGGAAATSGLSSSGNPGSAFGNWLTGIIAAGGGGVGNGNPGAGGGGGGASASVNGSAGTTGASGTTGGSAGTNPVFASASAQYVKALVTPGSGGGSGGNFFNQTSGSAAGGAGGGALYMECGGALNITSTINASGAAGSNSASNGGGGGGGGGGSVVILYGTLTANSATITVTGGGGGTAGTSGGAGGAGANGFSVVAKNTEFD